MRRCRGDLRTVARAGRVVSVPPGYGVGMRGEWLRQAEARGREAGRRALKTCLEFLREPRRLLLAVAMVVLLVLGVSFGIAGIARASRAVGLWQNDTGADWHRAVGRVVAVRDDRPTDVRVRYRDT